MKSEKEQYYTSRIIEELLENDVVTYKLLAEKSGIAERTVRNKISSVEDMLKEKQLGRVHKKPHAGIWLEADKYQREKLSTLCGLFKKDVQNYAASDKERLDETIEFLFQMKKSEPLTIAKLADKMYLSRPTAKESYNDAVEWFDKRNIKLRAVRNKGICIEGEERDYRKALRQYIFKKYENNLKGAVKIFLPGLDSKKIKNTLIEVEERWHLEFSDYSFQEICLCLCIAVYRMNSGHYIGDIHSEEKDEISKHKEYEFSIDVFDTLLGQKAEGIHILEAINLAETIMCVNAVSSSDKDSVSVFEYDAKLEDFVREIIACMSVILQEDLTDDSILYDGLLQHIRPLIFRLRYGYEMKNEMIGYVKQEYKQVYRAVWSTSPLFEEYFDVKIIDKELIYIALYVQVAMERRKRKLDAVLITAASNGYSQLLSMKIQKAIPRISCLKLMREQDCSKECISNYGIIFTTTDYPEEGDNVVKVPVMLTDESELEMKVKVKNLMENIAKAEEHLDLACYSLLDTELCIIQSDLTDKEQIIRSMTDKLENGGYVTPEYFNSVMEREKITTTAIGNGVAIPHGYSAGVNQSKVCICTLKKPIKWNDEMVDVIFLLAVRMKTEKELKNIQLFYKYFIRLTESDEKVNVLRNIPSGADMYKYFIS